MLDMRLWSSPVNWRCASLDMAFVASTAAPIGGLRRDPHSGFRWDKWIEIRRVAESNWKSISFRLEKREVTNSWESIAALLVFFLVDLFGGFFWSRKLAQSVGVFWPWLHRWAFFDTFIVTLLCEIWAGRIGRRMYSHDISTVVD